MNIEIKNLKIAKWNSEETLCFSAVVYVDGKRGFKVSNEGHGGPNIYPYNNPVYQKVAAHAKTLPPVHAFGRDLRMTMDLLIDTEIQKAETRKWVKTQMRKLLYVEPGGTDIYSLKKTDQNRKSLQVKTPAAIILNDLHIDRAVAAFEAAGLIR